MKSQAIALVVSFDADGNLLLLKRNRDTHCGDLWSFPGGKIETGESPKISAKRELLEETGLEGDDWKFLGDSTFEYPDRLLHFFLFSCQCDDLESLACESSYTWVKVGQLVDYPMPEANRALLQMIQTSPGKT